MKRKVMPVLFAVAVTLAIASMSCRFGAIGNLFATQTPTPTNTSTPTPTSTPMPTSTPTRTPTFTPTPRPTGVGVDKQDDGTILITDYDNLYQFTLPEKWVTFPLSNKDFANLIAKFAEENPDFANAAEALEDLDPNVIRIVALYANPDYIFSGSVPDVVDMAFSDKTLTSMPLDFITAIMEDSLKEQGFNVFPTTSYAEPNPNDVETTIIDAERVITTAQGSTMTARARYIFFQTDQRLIVLQLVTPKKFTEDMMAVADGIRASIKFLEP